jgi:hypothetical protein
MGLWGTVKGWLNIGGVKVDIQDLNQVVPKEGSHISGKVVLATKSDKTVTKVTCKFLLKKTTGRGEEKKTKEFVIAQRAVPGPLELKAGEERTLDLDLDYSLEKTLKDMGGVLGGVGKLAAFATGEQEEYFVVAQADVKGAALSPSKWVPVTVK